MAEVEPGGSLAAAGEDGGDEAAIYAGRARTLGLPFVSNVSLGPGARASVDAILRGLTAVSAGPDCLTYLAPGAEQIPAILHRLNCFPHTRRHFRVATPTAIRAALTRALANDLAHDAVDRLSRIHPDFSARRVATGPEVAVALAALACLVMGLVAAPLATLAAIDFVGAVFFLGVTALRFVAAGNPPVGVSSREGRVGPDLPVYSVLVPLRDEAAMIPDLIAALDRLDWPRDRLDVKLLLEAGDRATVAAARAAVRGAPYEIVVVPSVGPRTKPKALSFALPLTRGEFVTVFDAEDRPDPGQLRQAHAAFVAAGPDLACLQAALVIDNADAGWLPLLFAIEYAALFDGLLPALATLGMPLPLGGTSNHFRREALMAVGGWDPFNVTEDADIGLRLARFGYRTATIAAATSEDAPVTYRAWLRQRTRWLKGWMQTWLVHSRHPRRLARDLGRRGLLGFNLICTAIIVSTLIYPAYLLSVVALLVDPLGLLASGGPLGAVVLGVNVFNLFAGYIAMALLGVRALKLRGRSAEAAGLVLLPVYWLLMSVASYRAVFELLTRPHHWHKTPHQRRRNRTRD